MWRTQHKLVILKSLHTSVVTVGPHPKFPSLTSDSHRPESLSAFGVWFSWQRYNDGLLPKVRNPAELEWQHEDKGEKICQLFSTIVTSSVSRAQTFPHLYTLRKFQVLAQHSLMWVTVPPYWVCSNVLINCSSRQGRIQLLRGPRGKELLLGPPWAPTFKIS